MTRQHNATTSALGRRIADTTQKLAFLLGLFSFSLTPPTVVAQADSRRITDDLWKTVVRLESVVNTNGDRVIGTGFFVAKEIVKKGQTNVVRFLATNKHMIGDWNVADGDVSTYYQLMQVYCYSTSTPFTLSNLNQLAVRKLLLLHPDPKVDVAAVALLSNGAFQGALLPVDLVFSVHSLLSFTNADCIGLGDQVFALGYPRGITSLNNNYPLAKAGYISSIPGVPFRTRQNAVNRKGENALVDIEGKIYLVDGLLVPGNSGGPVITPSETKFRVSNENRRLQTRQSNNLVLGVMSMTMNGAGLSIVYSSDYLLELLDGFDSSVLSIQGNKLERSPPIRHQRN